MARIFSTPSSRIWLDALERIVVVVLFAWLCYRFSSTLSEKPANLLFLMSEGMVMLMVLFRRSTDQISVRASDWVVGFGGTLLTMLAQPASGGSAAGAAFMALGLVISVGAKLSLRRSFGVVAANRGVKRTGFYAVVRHPMYLGYFLSYIGMLILNPSIANAALIGAWAVLQIMRIHAEERILMRDEVYREHARQVRFRLVPHIY